MKHDEYIELNAEMCKVLTTTSLHKVFIKSISRNNYFIPSIDDKAFMLDLMLAYKIDIEFNYNADINPLTEEPYGSISVSAWNKNTDYSDKTEFYSSPTGDKSLALRVGIARAVITKIEKESK